MRGSLTLTVVFVDRNAWEAEGAEDCVPEGLEDCVPKGLPVCIVEVVATFHAVMDKGGSKGCPPLEHSSPKAVSAASQIPPGSTAVAQLIQVCSAAPAVGVQAQETMSWGQPEALIMLKIG